MGLSIFFKGSWKDFVAFCKSHALYRAPSHAFSKSAGPGDRTHFLIEATANEAWGRGPALFRCSFFPFFESSFFLLSGKAIIFDWQNYVYYSGTAGASFRFFPVYGPFLGKAPFMKAAQKLQTVTFSWQKACF